MTSKALVFCKVRIDSRILATLVSAIQGNSRQNVSRGTRWHTCCTPMLCMVRNGSRAVSHETKRLKNKKKIKKDYVLKSHLRYGGVMAIGCAYNFVLIAPTITRKVSRASLHGIMACVTVSCANFTTTERACVVSITRSAQEPVHIHVQVE